MTKPDRTAHRASEVNLAKQRILVLGATDQRGLVQVPMSAPNRQAVEELLARGYLIPWQLGDDPSEARRWYRLTVEGYLGFQRLAREGGLNDLALALVQDDQASRLGALNITVWAGLAGLAGLFLVAALGLVRFAVLLFR